MGLLTKINIMPYGPTHKQQIYALWAYSQRIILCLMGLLTNNKNMPYGPTCKEQIFMPYGPMCITE